ncbi:MAG: alpha/beta hydrolase [Roseibium sp.]|nr:alpha/beta hydrolase [Roseibium sp.]
MSAVPTHFTGAEGNRLAADCFDGTGQPVLLLHGGGQTRHSWDAAAERIAALGHVVYCMDQRGHGESDWVASGNYAFSNFASDLVAVSAQICGMHGAKPVLVGASLGGLAGMLAEGAQAPGSLAALVLVDITPRMDMVGVSKILGFMAERVEEGFETIEEAADAIALYMPSRARPKDLSGLSKNLRHHTDGRYRWHWDPQFIRTKQKTDRKASEETQAALAEAAARLDVPVLLVRGRNSELVTEEHVREFLDLVPHAKFVDIADAGHMVAGDRNDVFAEAVEGFLQELFASA